MHILLLRIWLQFIPNISEATWFCNIFAKPWTRLRVQLIEIQHKNGAMCPPRPRDLGPQSTTPGEVPEEAARAEKTAHAWPMLSEIRTEAVPTIRHIPILTKHERRARPPLGRHIRAGTNFSFLTQKQTPMNEETVKLVRKALHFFYNWETHFLHARKKSDLIIF